MQYSKFNGPQGIVRDPSSAARAVCTDSLEKEYFKFPTIFYFVPTILSPILFSSYFYILMRSKHKEIEEVILNPSNHHHLVGVVLTGIYIALYLLSLDISAIVFNQNHNMEYVGCGKCRDINLGFLITTLFTEIIPSILYIVLLCSLCLPIPNKLMLFGYLPSNSIYNDSSTISEAKKLWAMVGFLYVPFFFVCSHMGYILVSWSTEPTKTTSAVFLAMTINFILYISFRTFYQIFKTYVGPYFTHAYMIVRGLDKLFAPIVCCCPCRNWKNENCDKFSIIGFYITFIWSIPFAGYVACSVAALYIIPLPTSPLANYIENTVQILLVFLAALVSYKIIFFELSEVNIFFKSFKKSYESGITQFKAIMTIPQNINRNAPNNGTCDSINIASFERRLSIPSFVIQFIVTVENHQNVSARLQHHNLGEIAVSNAYVDDRRITSRMLQGHPDLSFQTDGNRIICAGAEVIVPISDVGISAACIIMCFNNDANDVRNILIPPYRTTLRISANSISVYLQNNNGGNGIPICENQTINNASTIMFKDITGDNIYLTVSITDQDENKHEVKLQSFRIEVNDGNLSITSADLNPQTLGMRGNTAIATLFSHSDAYSDHANPIKAYIFPKSTEFENPLDSTGKILGKIAHRVRLTGL